MPQREKLSYVTPLLKKPTLATTNMSNFRPISNLSVVSKLIEKCVVDQLNNHLVHNPLPRSQSGYRPHHSTETALLSFVSDIRHNMANNLATAAVFLDLSAAFDTVDHDILLNRMKSEFQIEGICLQWFGSYLHRRPQYVIHNGPTSVTRIIEDGLPQGSTIASPLYNVYSSPICHTVIKEDCSCSAYADDKGVYVAFNEANALEMLPKLQRAIDAVSKELTYNKLKLNPAKTELIVFSKFHSDGHHNVLKQMVMDNITVEGHALVASDHVKFLGVTLDQHLTLRNQVGNNTRISMWQLAEIRRIRPRLDQATAETLIRAFVMSRLDYCNSILYGLPSVTTKPMARVFNAAARSVTLTRKYDHITPVLIQLHWLPIQQRLLFKLMTLVYRCLQGSAPAYLSDQLSLTDSQRLSAQRILRAPTDMSMNFGHCATKAWNSLPAALRSPDESLSSFRKKLKTHLFLQAFGPI